MENKKQLPAVVQETFDVGKAKKFLVDLNHTLNKKDPRVDLDDWGARLVIKKLMEGFIQSVAVIEAMSRDSEQERWLRSKGPSDVSH